MSFVLHYFILFFLMLFIAIIPHVFIFSKVQDCELDFDVTYTAGRNVVFMLTIG